MENLIFTNDFIFNILYLTMLIPSLLFNILTGLARFAFMHCIGSSLCFWVNTIIDETLDSLVEKLTTDVDYCHKDYHTDSYYNEFDGEYRNHYKRWKG